MAYYNGGAVKMLTFNFSTYHLNPELSDVAIKITSGGAVQAELPGHGIVLANVSELFKQQIDEASVVLLDVEKDPLQALGARALVQYVYQGILPDTEQQALLVHLLHLAQKFAVHSCRAACLEALTTVDEQALQMDAIHVVFSLLSETAYQGFAPLVHHCLNRLQRQLGDLEATLSDQHLLGCLQQLPHAALLALLHDERTSASSENTVLAAVQSWLGAQPADVPVTAEQRQQLAAGIRIPFLEPMYMATVLPRIPWLLDVLGPAGLAAAAGAARGMCDPHAEPCLSNPRACRWLAVAWLKGPRPVPASCSSEEQGGPQISISWSLPLAQVKQVFEATSAAAAAAAARHKAEADAAAVRLQHATNSAAPGQQSWSASSAALAVSAAAAAAVNFGASMFRKRRHTTDQQADDSAAAAQGGSKVIGAGTQAAAADGDEIPQSNSRHRRGAKHVAASAAANVHMPQCKAAAASGADLSPEAGPGNAGNLMAAMPVELHAVQQQRQPLKAYSSEVQFAGYTWRLVLYFQQASQQSSMQHSTAAAVGRGSGGSGSGSGGQQARAAAFTLASGVHNQQQQQQAPHQQAIFSAVGAMDYLGCLQTPGGSKRARRAGAVTTAAGRAVNEIVPRQLEYTDAGLFGFGKQGGPALQAVTEAAAMGLADDGIGSPMHKVSTSSVADAGAECSRLAATAGVYAGAADGEPSGLVWHAKLAIEAWPCIALQPGVSTAAFSGSLAVQLGGISCGTETAEATAVCQTSKQEGGAAAAAPAGVRGSSSQPRSQCYQHTGSTGALRGRLLAGQKRHSTGTFAAANSRAPRSSINAIGEAAAAGHAHVLHSKRASAVAAAAKIAAGSDTVSESHDDDNDNDECSDDDVQLVEHEVDQEADELGRVLEVQEPVFGAAVKRRRCSKTAAGAAAAAGPGSHYGSMPVADTRNVSRPGDASNTRNDPVAGDNDCPGHAAKAVQEVAEQQSTAVPFVAPIAGVAPGAGAGVDSSAGSWVSFQLPQGSWVKSRRCDTGFRDFFGIQVPQGQWDEAAWARYLQPGGLLSLKGRIWNVR